MKDKVINIVNKYSKIFKDEDVTLLNKFLENHNDEEIIDWNNFDGHIVASGFLYAKKEDKFLVLFHKDMNTYIYPGGHVDKGDADPLDAAKREVEEETGVCHFKVLGVMSDELVPMDIDIHTIPYNERLDLPEHFHFDFRYLFVVDEICRVFIDSEESNGYKWVGLNELNTYVSGNMCSKISKLS